MDRLIDFELKNWSTSTSRKPLIMRGARQVGKTHAVRKLGKQFPTYIEINFEKQPELGQVFEKNLDPKRIVITLAALTKKNIVAGETLLFFDEIQACPKAITALRYFYEEMPELHIIAAGSLLDFAIEQTGVPVGRISYCYVYPLSFMEYLAAADHHLLFEQILLQPTEQEMDEVIHNKLFDLLGEYMLLGGMPEVISEWLTHHNLSNCARLQHTIIDTYRDDFPKYTKKLQIKYVETLFNQIPHMLGEQFKFQRIPGEYQKRELNPALDLLIKAGVVQKIYQTSGNGFPLGAEVNLEKFKLLFLDTALSQAVLGTNIQDWLINPIDAFINKGALAESFVGQELIAYAPNYIQPHLYYWHRLERSSSAEIDYLIQLNNHIIPIEVKSGKGTTLKSLNYFLENKKSPYGIRFSTHNYSVFEKLHSYPLYAIASVLAKQDSALHERLTALL